MQTVERWATIMKTQHYSQQELISLLKEWVQKNGHVPSKRQLNADVDMPSDMAYRKAFGSWGKALVLCGYKIARPYPSKQCREAAGLVKRGKRGADAPHWKGGKFQTKEGYIVVWDSSKKKYIREHRMVVEQYLQRELDVYEDVHHKNGIKDDNRIENLVVLSRSKHSLLHEQKEKEKHRRKNTKQCIYPGCNTLTSSKYGLCSKHYRSQWGRVKNGSILDLFDFTPTDRKHSDETKEILRQLAKQQKREGGRFA